MVLPLRWGLWKVGVANYGHIVAAIVAGESGPTFEELLAWTLLA